MPRFFLSLVALLGLAIQTAPATQVTIFDNANEFSTAVITSQPPIGTTELAYQFIVPPGRTARILAARVLLSGNAAAGQAQVRIYSNDLQNGVPLDEIGLASGATVNVADPAVTQTTRFDFSNGPILASRVTYWIGITSTGGDGQFVFRGPGAVLGPPAASRTAGGQWESLLPAPASVPFSIILGNDELLPATDRVFSALPSSTFRKLRPAAINSLGEITLAAKIQGGDVTKDNDRVIAFYGVRTELIAREGGSTPLPNTTFESFGDPVINDFAEVAFTATVDGDDPTPAERNALFTTDRNFLRTVVRGGDNAVGVPDNAKFVRVNWFHLCNDRIYFGATVRRNDELIEGVWRWRNGLLINLTYVGEEVQLGGQQRTVARIASPLSIGTGNAQSRIAADSGKLTLLLTAEDDFAEVVVFQ